MIEGTCKLCGTYTQLCDSHLLAKSFHKLYNRDKDPFVVTLKKAHPTSKQIKNHLLCSSCEQLFATRGEQHVLKICFRDDGSFKLHDYLKSLRMSAQDGDIQHYIYEESEKISLDHLVYFGISVFWRSAIHRWKIGYNEYIRNYLGNYTEDLRLFLLDEKPYPANVSMHLFVDSSKRYPILMTPYGKKTGTYHSY